MSLRRAFPAAGTSVTKVIEHSTLKLRSRTIQIGRQQHITGSFRGTSGLRRRAPRQYFSTITTSPPSPSKLLSIAQEAEQLNQVASSFFRVSNKTERQAEPKTTEYEAALAAANGLLRLSQSASNALSEAIARRDAESAALTSSLHRSLLTVVTSCVNVILQNNNANLLSASDLSSAKYLTTVTTAAAVDDGLLLKTALQLARRANDLQLPLHFQLYKQLIQAATVSTQDDALVENCLEIGTWIVTNLDVPVDSHLFAPVLCTLLHKRQYQQVVDLLVAMRYLFDIRYLHICLTSDLLLQLRDIARDQWEAQETVDATDNEYILMEQMMCQLLSLLEPSIKVFLQNHSVKMKKSIRDDMDELLEDMNSSEVEDFMRLLGTSVADDVDLMGEDDGEMDQEEDDFGSEEPNNDAAVVDLAMESLFAEGHQGDKYKQWLSRLRKLDTAATSSSLAGPNSCQDSDTDTSVSSDRDFLYMRNLSDRNYEFPDVTSQFVELNKGRPVFFSPIYENILLQSEFDEFDLFESFSSDSDSESDLFDDEEDDDDDF
jgi:hypothetical protein